MLKVHSATSGVATGSPTASASSGIATRASPMPKVDRSSVATNRVAITVTKVSTMRAR